VINDATAVVRARAFVRSCGIDSIPVDIEKYLKVANAEVRTSTRLPAGAAGSTISVGNRHFIAINPNDSPERQRFTILHEIAHIVLDLPSKHDDMSGDESLYSYARRPPEEVVCDTFAAECLLPSSFLGPSLKDAVAGFDFIDTIATKFAASLACTASRVAVNAPFACAYALSQNGYVRFAAYSKAMRDSQFWVTPGIAVPAASITGRLLQTGKASASGIVPAHLWTSRDEYVDIDLAEEVRVTSSWNQALTLLWLDSGDAPDMQRSRPSPGRDEEEPLLKELDGVLPWPGRKRKR
jgi:hypothetical protein